MSNLTNPNSLIGKRVKVYRNLHKNCWSVQFGGLVVAHAETVKLKNVSFRVQQGGYARFLREGKKNVHAFIMGDLETMNVDGYSGKGVEVTYTPKSSDKFHTVNKIFKGREFFFDKEVLTDGFCSAKTVFVWNEED